MKKLFLFNILITLCLVCFSAPKAKEKATLRVKTGIEVLRDNGFDILKGKKVGLVTNPSGVDAYLNSTVDILFNAPEVELVALFGPEHGVVIRDLMLLQL